MKTFIALFSAAIVLTSCGGGSDATSTDGSDSTAVAEKRYTNVTALQMQPERFEHFFKVQGVVEAEYNAQVFPEVNARITDIKVKEGDKVSKGQLLMVMDSKIIQNQIAEIKSRLSLAETVFQKQETLWNQDIGSEMQYLEAKNNFESLSQNLETLEAQLDMYTVEAPFAGVIDEVVPKVGEMASPMMPAFRLINMNEVYLKADVTEGYLGKIKEGDSVHIDFPALEAQTTAKISRIGNFINPNNRTFKIRINLKNNDLNLKPNMLGELKIRDYMSDSTAIVPNSLIQMTPAGEEFVYTIKQANGHSVAEKVMIESGMSYQENTEVIGGLNGSEILVNKGARSIKAGDTIEVRE